MTDKQVEEIRNLKSELNAWKFNFKWVRARLRNCKTPQDTDLLLREVEKIKT